MEVYIANSVTTPMKVSVEDLAVDPNWKPPDDPVFAYLLRESAHGTVPVYFAAIPRARVVRYDEAFHPERTKNGEAVVTAIMEDCRKGNFHLIWVYPNQDLFVASDDYFTLAAAELGEPEFLPCWVLGRPSETFVKDVQGPIAPEEVRKMLGLQIETL